MAFIEANKLTVIECLPRSDGLATLSRLRHSARKCFAAAWRAWTHGYFHRVGPRSSKQRLSNGRDQ